MDMPLPKVRQASQHAAIGMVRVSRGVGLGLEGDYSELCLEKLIISERYMFICYSMLFLE